jgi:hypothetical protein
VRLACLHWRDKTNTVQGAEDTLAHWASIPKQEHYRPPEAVGVKQLFKCGRQGALAAGDSEIRQRLLYRLLVGGDHLAADSPIRVDCDWGWKLEVTTSDFQRTTGGSYLCRSRSI